MAALQLGGDGEELMPDPIFAGSHEEWPALRHHLIRNGAEDGGKAQLLPVVVERTAQLVAVVERFDDALRGGTQLPGLPGSLRGDGGRFPALGHSRSIREPWQRLLRGWDRAPGAELARRSEPGSVWELANVAGEIGEVFAHDFCCQ